MALPQILEGTWEEIKQHDMELTGLELRVYIKSNTTVSEQKSIPAGTKENKKPKQLRGRGMLAGVLSTENYLRGKHEDIAQAAEAEAHSQPDESATTRPSVLGKYAFVAGGSEEFAKEKQAEIEREDRFRG